MLVNAFTMANWAMQSSAPSPPVGTQEQAATEMHEVRARGGNTSGNISLQGRQECIPKALEILGKPLGVAPRARSLSRGGCNHHTSVIPPDTITRKSQGRVTHGAKALTNVSEVTGWPSHPATKSSSRQRCSSGTIRKPTTG